MEVQREYGVATMLTWPMVSSSTPESFVSGLDNETISQSAFAWNGATWSSWASGDNIYEHGATGLYYMACTAGSMQYDLINIKFYATGCADTSIIIYTGASGVVSGVRDTVVEANGSITLQQALSLILAVNAGRSTANGLTFQDPSGTSNRVVSVVDDDANRTSITITPST